MHAASPSNSSNPARGGTLTSFDLAFCRIVGASLVLLPWGARLVYRDRDRGIHQSSLLGVSPLSWNLAAGLVLVTQGILFGVLAALPVATKTIATNSGSTGAIG